MANKSALYRLADALLKAQGYAGLQEWVYTRRLRLQPKPWGAIASELARVTDGEVAVTSVALREWFADEMAKERAEDSDDDDDSTALRQEPLFLTAVS